LVFSDLAECSDIFNVYAPGALSQLADSTGWYMRKLDALYPIPKAAAAITVIFIHHPVSPVDDENFAAISRFLAGYFLRKGIMVKVTTTLENEYPEAWFTKQ
jgi:hypothetical protein